MELIDCLLEDATIADYLRQHPKNQWVEVIKKTLVYGIQSLSALQKSGFNACTPRKLKAEHSTRQFRPSTRKKKRRKSCTHLRATPPKKAELHPAGAPLTSAISKTVKPGELPAAMKAFYQQEFKLLLPASSP